MDWLVSRLRVIIEATYAPERAFERPLGGASFLIPLVVLGSASVLITILQLPLNLQWARNQLELAGAPADQILRGLEALRASNQIATFLIPLLLLVRWSIFAGIMWIVAQLALRSTGFLTLLNLVSFSYAPIVARDAVIYVIVLLRGDEALMHREGLNVAIGLNLLIPSIPLPWSALAGNVNLFEIWFALIAVVGLAKVSRESWKRSLAVFLPMWVFVWIVQFAMVSLGLAFQSSISSTSPGT